MKKAGFQKLTNGLIMLIIYVCVNTLNIFAVRVDNVLYHNEYINIKNNTVQLVKLSIEEDGIYIIKTTGDSDIILKMVDDENVEIIPNLLERNNNYFASYYLKANKKYCVKIKSESNEKIKESKLWLFSLNKSNDIKYLNEAVSGDIKVQGQDLYFRFIPQNTNVYTIKSYGKLDLYAQIYDEYGKKMDENLEIFSINFKIIKELEKDKTYYIRVYSPDCAGSFNIEVEKDDSKYREVIDMSMNEKLDNGIEGYIKKEHQQDSIKFIPDAEGEYKFIVISKMELEIDVVDTLGNSVAKYRDNNKNYSFLGLQAEKGRQYAITVMPKSNETGMYKLKILKFEQLQEYANHIVEGKNEIVLQNKEEYFKFRCPVDGIFNFNLMGAANASLELYDENGKCIKKGEECLYVYEPAIGGLVHKNDIVYLKVIRSHNILREECDIYVNNFSHLIKNCGQIKKSSIEDTISQKGQRLFYKFIPNEDGIYFIKSNCRMYIDGKLYDDCGNLLSENNDNSKLCIARKLKKNTVYYVQITDLFGEGTGDFAVDICLHNNTQDYPVIDVDVELEAEIEYLGDTNYYKFEASEDAIYIFSLKSEDNIKFTIINNCDNTQLEESNYCNLMLKKGESCLIKVFGQDELNNIGEYSLKIENFSKKVKDAQIMVNNKTYQGNLIVKDIEDYYVFIPKDSGYYCVKTIGDANTYVEAYNNEGEVIKLSDTAFDTNSYLVLNLEAGNKYLFKVGGEKPNDMGIYKIGIEKMPQSVKTEWIRINDITTDILGGALTCRLYKFITYQSGDYFVDNFSNTNIDIELYDKNEKIIAPKFNQSSINHKCYTLCGNNLYYLKLKSKQDQAGAYSIKMENITKLSDNMITLTQNNTQCGEILSEGQTNYYKFIPYGTQEYLISQMEGEEICIDIFDENGSIINCDAILDGINKVILEYKNTYYIRIRAKNPVSVLEYNFFVVSIEDLERCSQELFL